MKTASALRRALGAALLLGLLLLRGAAADAPRTLARCLPGGAPLVLEAEDLGDLLRRWQASPLRQRLGESAAQAEFARGRVALRLLERLAALEQSLGALTIERLAGLLPRRAALGLYDIGETSFVLVFEAPEQALRDLPGAGAAAGAAFERREHRGLAYLAAGPGAGKGEGRRGAPLRLAQIKGRLLIGNDPARFQEALLLCAADLGLPVAAGPAPPPSADRDPLRARLLPTEAELPRGAGRGALRVYLGRGALGGSRHFRRYWLLGAEGAADLDGALLALTLAPLGEVHGLAYRAGAPQPQALAPREADEALRLTDALPPRPYAQAQLTDAAGAAARLRELLPLPQGQPPDGDSDEDQDAVARPGPGGPPEPGAGAAELAAALAPAEPHRALELADAGPGLLLGRARLGVAVGLRGPAVAGPALEAALLRALGPLGAPPPAFVDEGGARVLRLPLLSGWALCWARRDDRLAVATDPELLGELLRAPPELLRRGAPLLRRVDLARAAAPYKDALKILARRDNWGDPAHRALYQESVGGLFDLARPVRAVRAATYRRGDLLIEQLRFVE